MIIIFLIFCKTSLVFGQVDNNCDLKMKVVNRTPYYIDQLVFGKTKILEIKSNKTSSQICLDKVKTQIGYDLLYRKNRFLFNQKKKEAGVLIDFFGKLEITEGNFLLVLTLDSEGEFDFDLINRP